jgi:uncharacterized protein YfbU (UPF0304 family)
MKLTDGERLIAIMLAEVMEALKLDREIDPTLVKSLVINDDGWAIKRKYAGIFASTPPADEIVKETGDILWMWGIIESSIAKLTGDQTEEAKGWHWNSFAGFDGNNDPHYGVARTMIEELGEFENSRKGSMLNSHSQTSLPHYREMWAKFDRYVHAGEASPLSFDALRDLCS